MCGQAPEKHLKKRELTQRINALAEELEDLRTEKNRILASFDLTDDKDMSEIRRWTKQQETAIQTLTAQQDRCQTELNTVLEEYKTICTHAANFDSQALWPERLKERESMKKETEAQLRVYFGSSFSNRRFRSAESDERLYLKEEEQNIKRFVLEHQKKTHEKRMSQSRKYEWIRYNLYPIIGGGSYCYVIRLFVDFYWEYFGRERFLSCHRC